jgi:hypothetical protein
VRRLLITDRVVLLEPFLDRHFAAQRFELFRKRISLAVPVSVRDVHNGNSRCLQLGTREPRRGFASQCVTLPISEEEWKPSLRDVWMASGRREEQDLLLFGICRGIHRSRTRQSADQEADPLPLDKKLDCVQSFDLLPFVISCMNLNGTAADAAVRIHLFERERKPLLGVDSVGLHLTC